jgi:hypothetical protein
MGKILFFLLIKSLIFNKNNAKINGNKRWNEVIRLKILNALNFI